jgi:flagellar M-ring protein FliF
VEQGKKPLQPLIQIFNKLSISQRLLIGGLVVLSFFFLIVVMFFLNEPNYSALYTNLASEDASQVIEHLTEQKIPYKIEDNGQTIRIPKEKLYEMRLALAAKGVPNSGIVGYEIFDKNTMGMSEFMQKLSYKRALEGELARTILQQSNIEAARVHIVFPAKSVFRDEQKDPTASVVLKLKNTADLPKKSVLAISHLIASSVEGLKPNKVTIVDSKGRLLSEESEDNSLGAISSKQYELKNNVENYLANKAQSILDNVLGYGNSIIKINVDLDFNQVEKTMETFDPESQVIISEQITKSESGGRSISDSTALNNENNITNYEVSKTVQRVIEGTGNIKRITVAAVINGITKEIKKGDQVETVVEPRPDEQLKKLEPVIMQSVGYNPERNDIVSVVSIPFESQEYKGTMDTESSPFGNMDDISNIIIVIASILAAMFVLKGLLKRLKNEKIIIGTVRQPGSYANDDMQAEGGKMEIVQKPASRKRKPVIEIGDIEDEISDEAISKKIRQEKIVNYVGQNPAEAAKLINLWLKEDEY